METFGRGIITDWLLTGRRVSWLFVAQGCLVEESQIDLELGGDDGVIERNSEGRTRLPWK